MPRMSEDQTSIQLTMPKETKEALQAHAEQEKISISQVVRTALEEYFTKRGMELDAGMRSWKRKT